MNGSCRLGVMALTLESERTQEHPFCGRAGFGFDLPHTALMVCY